MDLKDLKNIWQSHDKKLDENIRLNNEILKKMNLDKTHHEVQRFSVTPYLGLIVGLLTLLYLGGFIYHHAGMLRFLIPAGLIASFALFQLLFSIYQTSMLRTINYEAPVTGIQKKLMSLSVSRIRYLTITRFAYPLLWLPVLIVALQGIWGIDFYDELNWQWFTIQISLGAAFSIFGIWLSFAYALNKIRSPFLHKLLENIATYDITGQNLITAAGYLAEIKAFEKEG